MEKLTRLEEKVYLATYSQARFLGEISKFIYGEDASDAKQIIPVVKSLEKRGIVLRLTPEFESSKREPAFQSGFYMGGTATNPSFSIVLDEEKRVGKRKYVLANSDFLLKAITEKLQSKGIELSVDEFKNLQSYLYLGFRHAVSSCDLFDPGNKGGLEFLYSLLVSECTFSLIKAQYREMISGNQFPDEDDDFFLRRRVYNKRFMELDPPKKSNTEFSNELEEPVFILGFALANKLTQLAPVEAMLSRKNCIDFMNFFLELIQYLSFSNEENSSSNSQATSS